MSMNKANNRRRQMSKKKIERVFLQLLQDHDLTEIKVSEICKLAEINRSTFYSNYEDIYDLADRVKDHVLEEFASSLSIERGNFRSLDNYIRMLQHVADNQIFYRTYFRLRYNLVDDLILHYDYSIASQVYDDELLEYHAVFFKAGLTALLRTWLDNGCKESPEDILNVLLNEYSNRIDLLKSDAAN